MSSMGFLIYAVPITVALVVTVGGIGFCYFNRREQQIKQRRIACEATERECIAELEEACEKATENAYSLGIALQKQHELNSQENRLKAATAQLEKQKRILQGSEQSENPSISGPGFFASNFVPKSDKFTASPAPNYQMKSDFPTEGITHSQMASSNNRLKTFSEHIEVLVEEIKEQQSKNELALDYLRRNGL